MELPKANLVPDIIGGKQGPDEFDCSGFVYWCYRQAGATGPYMTTFGLVAKFAGTKYEVNDKNDLQPGDVIICNGIQHVVFYFGNGQTIGCSGGVPEHMAIIQTHV